MPRKKRKTLPESKVLQKLGLTKEEVRAAFGVETPDHEKPKKKGYLFLADQRKMRRRMQRYSNLVYARFLMGVSPAVIAGCLGVSEETVRVRLRKAGFFSK